MATVFLIASISHKYIKNRTFQYFFIKEQICILCIYSIYDMTYIYNKLHKTFILYKKI